ncbi:DNA-binding protein [Candidatus Roizmanbacteria bacterium CG_4_9_14_0_2_um_filter_39_13]|uniref:DNA-binding protein n=1 Tax=Candidatus Roizmanbacteria bacterium CG_4_9_14_0_2_um_filter_39_13 TaxID=1974839 RepID=A0A2M8F2T5_9BACT|nr:MAG: DNA-binding protein [Candidatus Roizmanbacteria bacterium CG_4_10_14_0_2_um_filter_39_12]PJC33624.1 MAG: DNA-binding protein [Candidatus Roizmanbacteria bacterium CG_4_9_14_0_2_um_filter_39_13]
MTQDQLFQNMLKRIESDMATADDLLHAKRFDWCLFIWHLVIERSLKALLVKKGIRYPLVHDLERLAREAKIEFTQEELDQLNEITTYNIEALYDEIKYEFYRKATKEYTTRWVNISKKLVNRIKAEL